MEAIAATAATKKSAAARALPWIHLAVRSTNFARACEETGEAGASVAAGCASPLGSGCPDGCAYGVDWTDSSYAGGCAY